MNYDDPTLTAYRSGLDSIEKRTMFDVLVDPANHDGWFGEDETPREVFDSIENTVRGYLIGDFEQEVSAVADILFSHYSNSGLPGFLFGVEVDGEMMPSGFSVNAEFRDGNDTVSLTTYTDSKYLLDNRETTGMDMALDAALNLDAMYRGLIKQGQKRGLMVKSDSLALAEAALADYDAVPEHQDVDVDITASLRDSLERILAEFGRVEN